MRQFKANRYDLAFTTGTDRCTVIDKLIHHRCGCLIDNLQSVVVAVRSLLPAKGRVVYGDFTLWCQCDRIARQRDRVADIKSNNYRRVIKPADVSIDNRQVKQTGRTIKRGTTYLIQVRTGLKREVKTTMVIRCDLIRRKLAIFHTKPVIHVPQPVMVVNIF